MIRIRWCATLVLLAACASGAPVDTSFDSSAGVVEVEILGDGFVTTNEERMPLEAFVLKLRQATRRMTPDELLRFVVRVRFRPGIRGDAAAKMASDGRDYLVKQLQIMGVRQLGL